MPRVFRDLELMRVLDSPLMMKVLHSVVSSGLLLRHDFSVGWSEGGLQVHS